MISTHNLSTNSVHHIQNDDGNDRDSSSEQQLSNSPGLRPVISFANLFNRSPPTKEVRSDNTVVVHPNNNDRVQQQQQQWPCDLSVSASSSNEAPNHNNDDGPPNKANNNGNGRVAVANNESKNDAMQNFLSLAGINKLQQTKLQNMRLQSKQNNNEQQSEVPLNDAPGGSSMMGARRNISSSGNNINMGGVGGSMSANSLLSRMVTHPSLQNIRSSTQSSTSSSSPRAASHNNTRKNLSQHSLNTRGSQTSSKRGSQLSLQSERTSLHSILEHNPLKIKKNEEWSVLPTNEEKKLDRTTTANRGGSGGRLTGNKGSGGRLTGMGSGGRLTRASTQPNLNGDSSSNGEGGVSTNTDWDNLIKRETKLKS